MKRILVDGAFQEETRVAVMDGGTLTSLDREISTIKQLKGNIYLAKVIRVEPSLQAAFINYGGDRHGFLPFSDIHPDYFNIPEEKKNDLSEVKFFNAEDKDKNIKIVFDEDVEEAKSEDFEEENYVEIDELGNVVEAEKNIVEEDFLADTKETTEVDDLKVPNFDEHVNVEDIYTKYKDYRIEDVIKEGQYLLVQVLKEERGEKGVALTTYVTLAGKYCVLMGNVVGKGGVSKKITNLRDRKILKNILATLNPENDKSIIIRTAGIGKRPDEILKDYIYLVRMWNAIKQITLETKAPAFIHSEDDLVKRTIRELCDDKVEEIIVEGQEAFRSIKNLTKLMIPEQKLTVKFYNEKIPLFNKMDVESQVAELYNNKVSLPSGGSIVIDQTEALVAIDVNSGKATKEKSIEETAVAINLEAAKEIARQLKLRDIGGLIVIDFIDMFEYKNRRTVEKAMRDFTANDKARIQIDRISTLGLLEMSRQRINASYGERISETCPCCDGKGKVKSRGVAVLSILRGIKYAIKDGKNGVVYVYTSEENVLYLINYKANDIKQIENDYNVKIFLRIDNGIKNNDFEIVKRQSLTEEESLNLNPRQVKGKVNEVLDDEDCYVMDDCECKKYEFNDNCYFEDNSNTKQNQNNVIKQQNKKNNNNQSKKKNNKNRQNNKNNKGFLNKIFGIFRKK